MRRVVDRKQAVLLISAAPVGAAQERDKVVVIELEDHTHQSLVIEVDDPAARSN